MVPLERSLTRRFLTYLEFQARFTNQTSPFDVVKSRIQNSPKIAGSVPKYNWAVPALGTIMKEEGFGALYKGFLPKVLRLGPGGGILLVVFTGMYFPNAELPKARDINTA